MESIYCVYVHTNKINGKKYVGITSQKPNRRWGCNGDGYKSQMFYKAIQKYGWDNFDHEILYTDLDKNTAGAIEMDLIERYKTNVPEYGYNLSIGGDYNGNVFMPVDQYSLNGELLHSFASIKDACLATNANESSISSCCVGRIQSSFGYIWRRKGEPFDKYDTNITCTYDENGNVHYGKPVNQYSVYGKYINTYPSIREADKFLNISSGVSDVCNKRSRTAGGYVWRFTSECNGTEDIDVDMKYLIDVPIIQYDLQYNKIAIYPSIAEASRKTGFSSRQIIKCCKNQKYNYKDFIWQYINQ